MGCNEIKINKDNVIELTGLVRCVDEIKLDNFNIINDSVLFYLVLN